MSTEDNKRLIRDHYKRFSAIQGEAAKVRPAATTSYAPDAVSHRSDAEGDFEASVKGWASFIAAFPDMRITVEDMIAEGDKVVTRYLVQGTHLGTFRGIPPTGRKVQVKWVTVHRIRESKIVEMWEFPDMLGFLTQLGAIPGAGAKG